jgi:hypothetical protein
MTEEDVNQIFKIGIGTCLYGDSIDRLDADLNTLQRLQILYLGMAIDRKSFSLEERYIEESANLLAKYLITSSLETQKALSILHITIADLAQSQVATQTILDRYSWGIGLTGVAFAIALKTAIPAFMSKYDLTGIYSLESITIGFWILVIALLYLLIKPLIQESNRVFRVSQIFKRTCDKIA